MILPEIPPKVLAAYDAAPLRIRHGLYELRGLIFAQAARMARIGPLTEALRWGQPAFLTLKTGAACSLRIGPVNHKGSEPPGFALFVHCQTGLIAAFSAGAGHGLRFDGTRAVLFDPADRIDPAQISVLIGQALGYHQMRHPGPRGHAISAQTP